MHAQQHPLFLPGGDKIRLFPMAGSGTYTSRFQWFAQYENLSSHF